MIPKTTLIRILPMKTAGHQVEKETECRLLDGSRAHVQDLEIVAPGRAVKLVAPGHAVKIVAHDHEVRNAGTQIRIAEKKLSEYARDLLRNRKNDPPGPHRGAGAKKLVAKGQNRQKTQKIAGKNQGPEVHRRNREIGLDLHAENVRKLRLFADENRDLLQSITRNVRE